MLPHINPQYFVQLVENALDKVYYNNEHERWVKIHRFYEARYLNPDSPEKKNLYEHTDIKHGGA